MPTPRRLIAVIAAVSLGWSVLALGVAAPAARADGPAVAPTAAPTAGHDPATYYAGTDGLSGATLAAKLHTIVKADAVALSYAQVYEYLPLTDPDTAQPGYLIDFYSGTSILASNRCSSSCPIGSWNREHTWPQSHGNFGTSAGIGTDLHHMRPEFGNTNSSRGNLDFDNTAPGTAVPNCADCRRDSDSFEPRAAVKGDLARGLLFMAVRYESDDSMNLKMNDQSCNGSGPPNMGKLSTLVSWSLADPPDDRERTRNNLVDASYQHNRNPFIDHPEWVPSIFGNGVGLGPACGSTSGSDYVPGGTGPANTAPTTSSMTRTTPEDTAVQVPLTGSDADGDPLTWTVRQPAPAHGTATVDGSTLTYTPAANFNGTDQVGVRVSDGRGGTADTSVTITVMPVNDAPTAVAPASAATSADTPVQVGLLGTDVDGDTLTYAVTQPAHGTVSLSGSVATYTPAAGYSGPDSFTFTASDAALTSAPATVSISVAAPAGNHLPVATPTSATTAEDQPVTFTLAGADEDGDPLSYSLFTQPSHGSVRLVDNVATYTPARDYHGSDSFTFRVVDPAAFSSPATVSLEVTPVNDPPVATTPVAAATRESKPVMLTLSGTDVDGDALTYALSTPPATGTGVVTLTGSQATFTPAAGFTGTASFGWTVSDGTAAPVPGTASVTVTANRAPTASAQTATTRQDGGITLLLTGSDPDGDALAYAATQPSHGRVDVAGATATYTPAPGYNGSDTFTYTASDYLATSAAATVTIEVTPNHAPTITVPTVTATAGSPVTVELETDDQDGDAVNVTDVTSTSGVVTSVGTTITYTPSSRAVGQSFQVTVSDDRGLESSASVGVTVGARTASLQLVTPTAKRGTRVTSTIRVTDTTGGTSRVPTGTVTLQSPDRILGTATLRADGNAAVSWTPGAAGLTHVAATYDGDALFGTSTPAVESLTVARSPSGTAITAGPLRRGRAGVVSVTVRTVAGVAATGTVSATIGSRRLTARLVGGVATFRVARLPRTARLKVVARYSGDRQYLPGSSTRTWALKK